MTPDGRVTRRVRDQGGWRTRSYPFYASGAGSLLNIEDDAGPFLARLAREFPAELNRALRHLGWWLRQELRQGMANNAPGGEQADPLSDIHVYRLFDDVRGRHKVYAIGSRRRLGARNLRMAGSIYGRLIRAVGYRHDPGRQMVQVGWLSSAAAARAAELQAGGRQPITARMRRFAFAAGVPLGRDKTHIDLPARPVIDPTFEAVRGEIPERVERRMALYIGGLAKAFGGAAA